jgi:nicotinamide mononucleotide (NMN) deamidase PncC
MVYFAVDDGDNIWTERMLFEGDRATIKRSAADYLIGLVIRALG